MVVTEPADLRLRAISRELHRRGVETYHASVDDWQRPAHLRHRRGRFSPEGYFCDGFDYEALKLELLEPFEQGSPSRLAVYDVSLDRPIPSESILAGRHAILIVDGVFLLREELRRFWEVTVYLFVDADQSVERGVARDALRSGDEKIERRLYAERYRPGQDLYHLSASPIEHADILIDNTDVHAPAVLRS